MTLKVVAYSLDSVRLELILEDGTSYNIPQGHRTLEPVLADIMPAISAGVIAEVNLDKYSDGDIFRETSKESGGILKFFRVAKSKLANLFGSAEEPSKDSYQDAAERVKEVIASSQEIRSTQPLQEDETIVAQVGDSPVLVPGMEHLKSQFQHALNKLGTTEGIENFLKQLGEVIHERQHSVEDLITFLARADLPIANDGSIIAYKGLDFATGKFAVPVYVDSHSKRVLQAVGSKVHMDMKNVDLSRHNDCAAGLHIAQKGYLGSFRTDVITLVRVWPKDVLVVPTYDPTKMRVMAYDVLCVLSDEAAQCVRTSTSFDHIEADAKKLATAVAGKYPAPSRETFIGGPRGTELQFSGKPLQNTSHTKQKAPEPEPVVEKVDHSLGSNVEDFHEDAPVAPVDVQEVIQQVKPEAKKMTRLEEIQQLAQSWADTSDPRVRKDILRNVLDLKRVQKKSWEKLGVDKALGKRLNEAAKNL